MAIVLLVESDPHVRKLAQGFLTSAGHEVHTADDGAEALGLVVGGALAPTLVVTEILLPKLDGLALCRELKGGAETARIGVVILSMLAAVSRSQEAGADAFLRKPLTQKKLLDVVQRVLDGAAKETG